MPNAELETITLQKLSLIAQRARREPKCQFTSLAHLLNERFLEHCYHRLGRDRASGIDGVTWQEYGENLEENLKDLVARLKARRYKPLPARRVYIPKDEHSKRPLGLPAFDLELHPEKTRVLSFGRYERENAKRQNRRAHTFDFLGFTHFCGTSRRGKFIVGRRTSRKKFRKKCKELNQWLQSVRNRLPVVEWWPILAAKLRGHYQYYGVSGNMPSLNRYYRIAQRLTFRWLNRRSQRCSFNWDGFNRYLEHYPLPTPRIVHNLYTLSPVT